MFKRRVKLIVSDRTAFDDPVFDELLALLARERPEDVEQWRAFALTQFSGEWGARAERASFFRRMRQFLRDKAAFSDQFAEMWASGVMHGRILRQLLDDRPELVPPEARGKVPLTETRTAWDSELAALLDAFRRERPGEYAAWRAGHIKLDKYHRIHNGRAPLTVALDRELFRGRRGLEAFLKDRCWSQSHMGLLGVELPLRLMLLARVPSAELEITESDLTMRVDVPSDEDVLAYLEGFDLGPVDERSFNVRTLSRDDLRCLTDLLAEITAREKELNWAARGSARSSEAGDHAQRFRMMKELYDAVRAELEEVRRV